jgi:hypothetical protein
MLNKNGKFGEIKIGRIIGCTREQGNTTIRDGKESIKLKIIWPIQNYGRKTVGLVKNISFWLFYGHIER